ncbi:hypothetical protein FACS189415_6510 [Bacteroidia bacterium]|nr:hypothetical protein FACS189415_6510 [Bacteroidia bacterium]
MDHMDRSSLPMNALSEIPTPGPNAQQITALTKRGGRITGYQLSNGKVISKEEGVQLARQGGILGVGISKRNGSEYLKALPNNSDNNNLSSLPTIPQ